MRLSVCMIARNEAARLAAALRSVRGVADEIILVDTGSTDETIAIAESCGARIVHHPWNDDFAAARNAALPHIRGRWMLWLDADERLVADSCDLLPAMLAREDALAYSVIRRDYIGAPDDNFAENMSANLETPRNFVASRITRLARADVGLQFTGRCHEQLDPPLGALARQRHMTIYASAVVLDHDCDYFFDGRVRKSRRNSPLLELEIRERPGRLYFMVQCAASLLELPDTAGRGHAVMADALVLLAAQRDRERPSDSIAYVALEYVVRCPPPPGVTLALTPDDALVLADRWFPNAAPVVWLRAQQAHDRGDYQAAVPLLRRLLNMGRTHAYDLDVPFDPCIVGDDAHVNLGVCLLRLGELNEAEAEFRAISSKSPRAAQASLNLRTIEVLRRRFST